ncbi:ribosome-associated protein [Jatrophihabitans endophyticus]|uniref:Ribosome-associated protein n=1 Tax=Jatrophihabitans endophyticus TaxID=1206085 RepID=A0A1M5SW29_9ACTN|nr:alternative ribosome rescue aminoacyl-tRNA hydrolase ArfB [Jatrophihabitans endophyticus]SHH42610.1 ribosome-associated protein [Jatrophihabitans endophyticus]
MPDLVLRPQRGLPTGLTVPEAELVERFSRSSGPGGQSVNTTDSRVELRWDVAASTALTDEQRARLLARLAGRLVDGALVVVASEQRSQLQNRTAARGRLGNLVAEGLAPPPAERRASRPSRRAKARRVEGKRRRGELKATRRRPGED